MEKLMTFDGRTDILLSIKDFFWKYLPRKLIDQLVTFYYKGKKGKKQSFLILHVFAVSKCNLNCKSCSTFAPIANESTICTSAYENDCKRLSFLGSDKVKELRILGGEPLLHLYCLC